MPRIRVLLILLCLASGFHAFSQIDTDLMDSIENSKQIKKRAKTTNNVVLISPYYTALFPIGEMANTFGFSDDVGLSVAYKIKKNFLIGLEGAYLFGSKVKNNANPLNAISTQSTGQIIGQDGSLNNIPITLSGFEIALRIGKLIPTSKKHPNSGVLISLAPGFLQHKLFINANANNIPQLNSTYKEGYDRLTNGPMIAGNIGYLYLERKKFLSFQAGLDFAMGFTQERRNWNFDLMSADKHQHLDMLIGIKVVWNIPVFTNRDSEVYYR